MTFRAGGIAGGIEIKTPVDNFGTSLAYLTSGNADGATDNEIRANQVELAGYWSGHWNKLRANARFSAASVAFDGSRHFAGAIGTEKIERLASAKWNGNLVSASGGGAYDGGSGIFFVQPAATIDYYCFQEKGNQKLAAGRLSI